MTEGAILERWRLVLGEPAQGAMPLTGLRALEMDQDPSEARVCRVEIDGW